MARHWIFDLDGTLVDSFHYYFLALESLLNKEGLDFTEHHKREALSEHPAKFLARYLGAGTLAQALDHLLALSRSDAQIITTYEHILESLALLKDHGANVGIWTSRPMESAKIIIDSSGLAPFVDIHLSGDCVSRPKPDSQGLREIAQFFQCAPDEIIMVGDHEHDMMAAKDAGARGVRASWHGHWVEETCSLGHEQFYSSLDFSHWLREQLKNV